MGCRREKGGEGVGASVRAQINSLGPKAPSQDTHQQQHSGDRRTLGEVRRVLENREEHLGGKRHPAVAAQRVQIPLLDRNPHTVWAGEGGGGRGEC